MPFLSGSLGFERFRVSGFAATEFGQDQLEKLEQYASGQQQSSSSENALVGFLGGEHLFDQVFDVSKNVINEALHCSVRIDTNQIPSAIRKAWLQMELAALAKDNESGRPTKSQRQEAKEAVEQRCADEAATGKYRKMQQFPVLWDASQSLLYFGGSGAAAVGHCADLFERAFEVELSRVTAGTVALSWAEEAGKLAELADVQPACFLPQQAYGEVAWANEYSDSPDFLGNEFLLWLWWKLENESDTLQLLDNSELTVMLAKTLSLECPLGEHGKETISAECPTKLSESMQAIRSGKLPRKTGMSLVRGGQQFDLVLQAESLAVSGAKIHVDEARGEYTLEDRIEDIRILSQTVDQLFQTFCARRVGKNWSNDLQRMGQWLGADHEQLRQKPAA